MDISPVRYAFGYYLHHYSLYDYPFHHLVIMLHLFIAPRIA
jgi:hypothetical protein